MAMNPITSDIYIAYHYHNNDYLTKDIYKVGKLSSDKTFQEIECDVNIRIFSDMAATTSGDIIIYGYEIDAFNKQRNYSWEIASNENSRFWIIDNSSPMLLCRMGCMSVGQISFNGLRTNNL